MSRESYPEVSPNFDHTNGYAFGNPLYPSGFVEGRVRDDLYTVLTYPALPFDRERSGAARERIKENLGAVRTSLLEDHDGQYKNTRYGVTLEASASEDVCSLVLSSNGVHYPVSITFEEGKVAPVPTATIMRPHQPPERLSRHDVWVSASKALAAARFIIRSEPQN